MAAGLNFVVYAGTAIDRYRRGVDNFREFVFNLGQSVDVCEELGSPLARQLREYWLELELINADNPSQDQVSKFQSEIDSLVDDLEIFLAGDAPPDREWSFPDWQNAGGDSE